MPQDLKIAGQLVAVGRTFDLVVIATKKGNAGNDWVDTIYSYEPYEDEDKFSPREIPKFKKSVAKVAAASGAPKSKYGRLHIAEGDRLAVIGENTGIAREVIIRTKKAGAYQMPEAAFTLPVNEGKAFASFQQQDQLNINMMKVSKESKTFMLDTYEKITVGKTLMCTPYSLSGNKHIIFVQVNTDDKREVSVFNTEKAAVECRVTTEELGVPNDNIIQEIYLTIDQDGIWLYHYDKKTPTKNGAVLWKPNIEGKEEDHGKLAEIESLSDQEQLIPKKVEEDGDKLNIKDSTGKNSAHISDIKKKFNAKYKEEHMKSWWYRIKSLEDMEYLIIDEAYDDDVIVCSAELRTIYIADSIDTSKIKYKLWFYKAKMLLFLSNGKLFSLFYVGQNFTFLKLYILKTMMFIFEI